MKAVVCYGNGDIRYENVADIHPKTDEVRIKVMTCGICGSDVQRANGTSAHSYPIILGHEFCGITDEIGDGVNGIRIGEKVTAAPLIQCGTCEQCENGDYSLCQNYNFTGSRCQGAMAEYICMPAKNIIKLSNNISFEQGALFEPATVALHAIKKCNLTPDSYTAVFGGGTIGVFIVQWAKIFGCKNITVFGRNKEHLDSIKIFEADNVISMLEDNYEKTALEITSDKGFDNIFEAAGAVETLKSSLKLAAKKADICIVGTQTKEISLDSDEWNLIARKELTIKGSWMSYSSPFPGDEWAMTKKCFENGSLKYDMSLFHKQFEMKNAKEAFELFKNPEEKIRGRILLKNCE